MIDNKFTLNDFIYTIDVVFDNLIDSAKQFRNGIIEDNNNFGTTHKGEEARDKFIEVSEYMYNLLLNWHKVLPDKFYIAQHFIEEKRQMYQEKVNEYEINSYIRDKSDIPFDDKKEAELIVFILEEMADYCDELLGNKSDDMEFQA